MIRFLLGHRENAIAPINPNTSVLDYLREHLHRTGTKEGCATGDCGACTVVLGEVDPGDSSGKRLRYRSVNACITDLGALHGRQLITVEDLRHEGSLHAVQQAMVDHHGSQCGFCTPGFVMSLFAHHKSHRDNERTAVVESLGGNLCRCTGYRPILDAARHLDQYGREDQFSAKEEVTAARLQNIERDTAVALTGEDKRYFAPRSITDLCKLLAENRGATLIAGGTDLFPELNQSLSHRDLMVGTGRVAELQRIDESGRELEIGASVPLSDCGQVLVRQYPDLEELINRFGSLQIRNRATLGGHIANASPVADLLPFLIVVGANLKLRTGNKTRITAVEDFFLGYKKTALRTGEFIESILVPKSIPDYLLRIYKISKRLNDDVSISCGAFYIHIEEGVVSTAKIAFGGMDEVPRRAVACEQALQRKDWCQDTVEEAMQALATDFEPISDFRASADYRMQASRHLLQRLFLESQDEAARARVTHCG